MTAEPTDDLMLLGSADRRAALDIARRTLELRVREGRTPAERDLPVPAEGGLRRSLACFVTLMSVAPTGERDLRGCIGALEADRPLWASIRDGAVNAATRDPRFPPVRPGELGQVEIEVSVLTPLRSIPGPEAYDPARHGIVLRLGSKRAVFLPVVARRFGWDRETTLGHLARKAGLSASAWRDPGARFEVFEAQELSEGEERRGALS